MKRPSLAWLVPPLVLAYGAWVGCSTDDIAGSGGNGGSGGYILTGLGGMGGMFEVTGPTGVGGAGRCDIVDGVCDISAGEGCACVDCQMSALCNPDQCIDTDSCDHVNDSCVCAGCAEDPVCGTPAMTNCVNDGMCDTFNEGCHCKDCYTDPNCAPRVAACNGGKADGKCDYANGETCACVDCEGTPLCVPCDIDGTCGPSDPCSCVDCIHDIVCNDPTMCVNDGVCDIIHEGCICPDCASWPQCQQWLDGGTDGGDAGGQGGGGVGGGSAGAGGSDAGAGDGG
jgi:hypothetical protein